MSLKNCLCAASLFILFGLSSCGSVSKVATNAGDPGRRSASTPAPSSGVVPAGWTVMNDQDGYCQAAIPAGWQVAGTRRHVAHEPSNKVSVTLISSPLNGDWESWKKEYLASKQGMEQSGWKITVIENNEGRLRHDSVAGEIHERYLLTPTRDHVCHLGIVTIKDADAAKFESTFPQILDSLKVVR